MFNLLIGSKYKRLEVMKMFNPDIKNYSQSAYWTMKHSNIEYFLVFCNVDTASTNINGSVFDYPNFKVSDNEFIWCTRNGVSSDKNELLKKMESNPQNILFFYRTKKHERGLYTFFGSPQIFSEIQKSLNSSEPSKYRLVRYETEALKEKVADDTVIKISDLIEEIKTDVKEETGLKAEFFIRDIILNKKRGYKKIEEKLGIKIDREKIVWWYLKNKRKNRDFDIHDFFIEVKATNQKELKRFFMSENEITLAKQNPEKYYMIMVKENKFEILSWKEVNKTFKFEERVVNVFTK